MSWTITISAERELQSRFEKLYQSNFSQNESDRIWNIMAEELAAQKETVGLAFVCASRSSLPYPFSRMAVTFAEKNWIGEAIEAIWACSRRDNSSQLVTTLAAENVAVVLLKKGQWDVLAKFRKIPPCSYPIIYENASKEALRQLIQEGRESQVQEMRKRFSYAARSVDVETHCAKSQYLKNSSDF